MILLPISTPVKILPKKQFSNGTVLVPIDQLPVIDLPQLPEKSENYRIIKLPENFKLPENLVKCPEKPISSSEKIVTVTQKSIELSEKSVKLPDDRIKSEPVSSTEYDSDDFFVANEDVEDMETDKTGDEKKNSNIIGSLLGHPSGAKAQGL